MSTDETIERLRIVRHSLRAAREVPRSALLSDQYKAGINDGIDVALNLIALEIEMAENDAAEAHQ
jgi:hypothetical protein